MVVRDTLFVPAVDLDAGRIRVQRRSDTRQRRSALGIEGATSHLSRARTTVHAANSQI
jgi:hypothetical protein